jgi:hypothetical protein
VIVTLTALGGAFPTVNVTVPVQFTEMYGGARVIVEVSVG